MRQNVWLVLVLLAKAIKSEILNVYNSIDVSYAKKQWSRRAFNKATC
jgi:hypothetical protein